MSDPRASLPALTALLELAPVSEAIDVHGRDRVVAALRAAVDDARDRLDDGDATPSASTIAADALGRLERDRARALDEVVNATGVLLHTNLGRAPLSATAIEAMGTAARATNLEIDLATGERGGREAVARAAIARLTGAEDAVVVNNGAAALVLALSVLAAGREVVVSRGELIEIGGSFRLPDVVRSAGVVLHEVGTTNRTHLADYRGALTAGTGAVLRVHPSNFHMAGFVTRPSAAGLAEVAHEAGAPLVHDIGSGLLREVATAPHEPTAAAAISDGADLVAFSGDKLLGGPQAGILAGGAEVVARCRRHPLARALRLDKLRLAALEATLAAYERDEEATLPLWEMASTDLERLRDRAERLAEACGGEVVTTEAVLGGGAVPGARLDSVGVALDGDATALAGRLRAGRPPVIARIVDRRVVIDLRAVPEDLDETLRRAAREATRSR